MSTNQDIISIVVEKLEGGDSLPKLCPGIQDHKLFQTTSFNIYDLAAFTVEKSGMVRARNCLEIVEEDSFICNNCAHLFYNTLKDDSPKNKEFVCPQCIAVFPSSQELRSHFKDHLLPPSKKDFKCLECNSAFQSLILLNEHHKNFHKTEVKKKNNYELKEDHSKHPPKKKYRFTVSEQQQPQLSLMSTSTSSLSSSSAAHRKELGFNICPECKMEFLSHPRMIEHCKEKHGEASTCHVLGCHIKLKWTSYYHHLKYVHNGESCRTHTCDSCGASYKTKTELTRHIVKH